MSILNYTFFEEYKHLDKLCGELYREQRGISHYIDDMKEVSINTSRYIPNWKDDLDKLIRLRHIRNHLAHAEGAFNEKICTQKDIEWIQEFHKRILNQSDPLALLYQFSKAKQQMERTKPSVSMLQQAQPLPQNKLPQNNEKTEEIHKDLAPTNKEKQAFSLIILLFILLFIFVGALLLTILDITYLRG